MSSSSGSRVNAALLAAVVLLGLSHVIGVPPRASAQQAGGQQMFGVVAPGVGGAGSNVLFVLDPPSGRLLVYEHKAGGKLDLVAVRNITHETGFEEWNPDGKARGQQPPVADIVKELRGG